MTDKEKSKNQSRMLIGFALILIALVLIVTAIRTPSVISFSETVSETATSQTELAVTYPLDINTATAEELMTVNGIGEKRAYRIVAYRKEIGSYKSLDDLKGIRGFDDELVEYLSEYLTV